MEEAAVKARMRRCNRDGNLRQSDEIATEKFDMEAIRNIRLAVSM